jgi:hypothetical protein
MHDLTLTGTATSKGRTISNPATLVVAASNSKVLLADYYCDGTADEVQINAAIQALDGLGGRIVLLEGTYYINDDIAYSLAGIPDSNISLEGQGNATILKVPDGHASNVNIINAGTEAGSNIVTLSGWTATAGWTWHGSSHWDHASGTDTLVDDKSAVFIVGQKYKIKINYTYAGAGSVVFAAGGKTLATITNNSYSSFEYDLVPTATTRMTITPTTDFTGSVNSISVIQVLENLTFKNFCIDNNSANVTGTAYNGIVLWSVINSRIENVSLINGIPAAPACANGYGLLTIFTSDVTIANCQINRWETNGMECRQSDRLMVMGCVFRDSRVEVYSNLNAFSFINNRMIGTTTGTYSSLYIGTDNTTNIDGLSILNNSFFNTVTQVFNADRVLISGNIYTGMWGKVYISSDTNHISITNNLFAGKESALEISGTNGFIVGNKFVMGSNYATGIYNLTADAPVQWIIKNNQFVGVFLDGGLSYTLGINLVKGTNILIQDNDFQDLDFGIKLASTMTSAQILDNKFTNIRTTEYTNGATLSASYEYGNTNRRLYKITTAFSAYSAAALTGDKILVVLPAKTKIVGFYADTTTKYTGGAVSAATLVVGKSAGGGEYIASHDVFTAAIVKGQADADMGTELTRVAAIQGGALVDWTTAITVYARLTTTDANTSALTAGSTTFYIETESY